MVIMLIANMHYFDKETEVWIFILFLADWFKAKGKVECNERAGRAGRACRAGWQGWGGGMPEIFCSELARSAGPAGLAGKAGGSSSSSKCGSPKAHFSIKNLQFLMENLKESRIWAKSTNPKHSKCSSSSSSSSSPSGRCHRNKGVPYGSFRWFE